MSYLAQCFAKRKMFDLAARTLQNAIKEKAGASTTKRKTWFTTSAACSKAWAKKRKPSSNSNIIYEMDIGYKDVAAKVDAFYAGQ